MILPTEFTLATTSYIWPANIWENCKKLEDIVDEVSILFFETDSCMLYDSKDLPINLTTLNLTYHIHLPLDLKWENGPDKVFNIVKKLVDKVEFLNPTGFVLHPPNSKKDLLYCLNLWFKKFAYPIIIENTKDCDLLNVWEVIKDSPAGVCIDVGHLFKFSQQSILKLPEIWDKIEMLHLYGPANKGHGSLSLLSQKQSLMVKEILNKVSNKTKIVIEVFSYKDLKESLDIFFRWIRNGLYPK